MLLALYNSVQDNISSGIMLLQQGENDAIALLRLKIHRQLLGLIDGLNLDQGEIPRNVLRLLEFVWNQLNTSDPRVWDNGLRVIKTLKSGFEGIADEARRLEVEGKIPSLET
jgi:hypothetical protein